jgi:hypothetical protein
MAEVKFSELLFSGLRVNLEEDAVTLRRKAVLKGQGY